LLPTGTVTFLFTDIEGSTRLWETHPEQMELAFPRQETLLRQGILAHHGYPYKMIGDAFQAAFSSALDALDAALEIQHGLSVEPWGETPIRVRMALHTGVTEERGDDYVGPVLNRLARLLVAGYGGQILLTQATADLLIDQLPAGVLLKDLDTHNLKDLVRPEHIYQVVAPGLQTEFPALKTTHRQPNNLPVQLTSFIGRQKEMAELRELLIRKETRLVTLTGPGGTGKTRLSLQIAADLLDNFPGGTWLIELAPVSDPDVIPKLIATVLDIHETEDSPLLSALIDYLRAKKALLILDNCEHVVEACAALVDKLLRGCPSLLILASSREIFGIGGEIAFRVPSLTTPDLHHLPAPADIIQTEAVRLFVERAQAASPNFCLSDENAADVTQIVRRLDGIPLAIELAAARVRYLTPAQIASRLDDAFRLLTGGSRAVLPRHQTLRALIDWSYNLLAAPEIALLRRLSVFSGSWTLEAAEAVCADPTGEGEKPGVTGPEVLDVLTQLADKSLVISISDSGRETRYRMMETIRQYAHEKLVESGESLSVRNQHLAYFLSLAEQAEPFLRSRQQVAWFDRLESMIENIRQAMEWGLENDVGAELRLAAALMWFWHIRWLASEGLQWLKQGLFNSGTGPGQSKPPVASPVRFKALLAWGALTSEHDRPDRAIPVLEECLAFYQSLAPEGQSEVAKCYRFLATCLHRKREHEKAEAFANRACSLYRELGDRFGRSESLLILASEQADPVEARKMFLQLLALKQEIGDVDGIAFTLQSLSRLAFAEGDYQNALTWLDESLERFREVGNSRLTTTDLQNKAAILWAKGDYDLADKWIGEALLICQERGDSYQSSLTLLRRGDISLSCGDLEIAGQSYTEALHLAQETGNRRMLGATLAALGKIDALAGRSAQAEERYLSALATVRENHFPPLVSLIQMQQGKLALSRGDLEQADRLLHESLQGTLAMNDWNQAAYRLEALATLGVRRKEFSLAARLLGAANAHFRLVENTLPQPEREQRSQDLALLRQELGEEQFSACWQAGETLSIEQILSISL
jgi:predicted ATPase/class 3 adenylate cyclase